MTAVQLKKWREKQGLTQQKAAKLIGCSRRGYQDWERGLRPIPRYVALAIAALAFNLPAYGGKR